MDKLVQQLNDLRINRDEAAREYHRSVQDSSIRERDLLVAINREQRREKQFRSNIRTNRSNPIVKGDIVKITNDYDATDTDRICRVTYVTKRMVEMRCTKTNKYCKRAWWNVERVANTKSQ